MLRCEEVLAGIERGLKESKLLLDCVLIVTSVVPPELLMELPLSVNVFLVALSKFGAYPAPCFGVSCVRLTVPTPPQLSSAPSRSASRSRGASTCAASTRRGPSPVAGRRGAWSE